MSNQNRIDAGNERVEAGGASEWREAEQRWEEKAKLLSCDPYAISGGTTTDVIRQLADMGLLGKNANVQVMTRVVDSILKKAKVMRDSNTPTDLGRTYGISDDPKKPFGGQAIKPILIVLNQLNLMGAVNLEKSVSKGRDGAGGRNQSPVQRYEPDRRSIDEILKDPPRPASLESIIGKLFQNGFLSDMQPEEKHEGLPEKPSSDLQSERLICKKVLDRLKQDKLIYESPYRRRGLSKTYFFPVEQGSKEGILRSYDREGLVFNKRGKRLIVTLLTEMGLIVDPDIELKNRPIRREEERRNIEEARREWERKCNEVEKLGINLADFSHCYPGYDGSGLNSFFSKLLHELAWQGFLDDDEKNLREIYWEAFSEYIRMHEQLLREKSGNNTSLDMRPHVVKLWEMGLLNPDHEGELRRREAEKRENQRQALIELEKDWQRIEERLQEEGKIRDDFKSLEGNVYDAMERLKENGWLAESQSTYDAYSVFAGNELLERKEFGGKMVPTDLGREFGIIEEGADGRLGLTARGARLLLALLNRRNVLITDPAAELERRERIEAERREAERIEAERRAAEWRESRRRAALQRKEEIKKIILDRGIKKLYHFTQARNLDSIFEHGILSRDKINGLKIDATVNDRERWDGHTDAISVSISGANYRMLYALGKGKQNRGETCPGDAYVLLELDPSLLYELDCAFYPTNAASNRVRHASKTEFQSAQALEDMFADGVPCPAGAYSRAKWGLDPCETSDPQAEVLVFETIPAHYINCVLFETEDMDDEYCEWVTDDSHIPYKIVSDDDKPFMPRCDFSDWRKSTNAYDDEMW